MTELEIINAVGGEVAAHNKATAHALDLVEQGLKLYPRSPRLWILRGDLIQVSDDTTQYELEDALKSYRAAVRLDPRSPEAYESLGRYFDAVENRPREAESYFRKAIELGGGDSARDALAEVLEQLGRSE